MEKIKQLRVFEEAKVLFLSVAENKLRLILHTKYLQGNIYLIIGDALI